MALLQVQSKQCSTCIYRANSPLDLAKLEAQCADKYLEDFFAHWRECHHAEPNSGVVCRGFWNRHKNSFTAGQIAKRLNSVEYVDSEATECQKTSSKRKAAKKS
jgi:hypothetical protein